MSSNVLLVFLPGINRKSCHPLMLFLPVFGCSVTMCCGLSPFFLTDSNFLTLKKSYCFDRNSLYSPPPCRVLGVSLNLLLICSLSRCSALQNCKISFLFLVRLATCSSPLSFALCTFFKNRIVFFHFSFIWSITFWNHLISYNSVASTQVK